MAKRAGKREKPDEAAKSPLSSDPVHLQQMIAVLKTSLEEVETVEAELRAQNEELTATKESLERERHRYKDLFEGAPLGYLVTDQNGVILEANQAVSALLSTSRKALQRKPFSVFIQPSLRRSVRSLYSGLRPGHRIEELELVLQLNGGDVRTAVVTVTCDKERTDLGCRLFWILRDISDKKAAEKALRMSEERLRHSQRLEAIGRLAGGIAHSFNNLLAAMAFHADLMLPDLAEGSKARHHADEIQQALDRAARLARQLLAFGRKQMLNPQVLQLNRVIREAEPILRRLIGEDIRLDIELGDDACPLYADLGQLEQVLLNLVVNARDAMPTGGTLRLSTATRELATEETWGHENLPPGRYAVLTVSDTGTGMSREVLSHLFEPFFTTKDRDKGSGLGLATVHGIVCQSGGAIRVESALGRGSSFTILLPRTDLPAGGETATEPAMAPPRPASSEGGEVVLLVEDEENIRQPGVEILADHGYVVLSAGDATEALAVSQRHDGRIDLLITDVIMPGMSGSQLAAQLLNFRPETRVLFISGYPEDDIAHHDLQAIGHAFLQKPFPPSVLLATARQVLDGQEPGYSG